MNACASAPAPAIAGEAPSATSLDGRRVAVQLRDKTDPDLGGQYTLKRWRVTRMLPCGAVEEIELRPDNRAHQPWLTRAEGAAIRSWPSSWKW